MSEMPAELVGQMAAVGTTHRDMAMCPSCSRALLYAAMAYAGCVKEDLDHAQGAMQAGVWDVTVKLQNRALIRVSALMQVLVKFCHADFAASISAPDAEDLDEVEWKTAISTFLRCRMEHYINADTGEIQFESHEATE